MFSFEAQLRTAQHLFESSPRGLANRLLVLVTDGYNSGTPILSLLSSMREILRVKIVAIHHGAGSQQGMLSNYPSATFDEKSIPALSYLRTGHYGKPSATPAVRAQVSLQTERVDIFSDKSIPLRFDVFNGKNEPLKGDVVLVVDETSLSERTVFRFLKEVVPGESYQFELQLPLKSVSSFLQVPSRFPFAIQHDDTPSNKPISATKTIARDDFTISSGTLFSSAWCCAPYI
jgi:hypothetical protein